jgi:hypothetical protein
VSHLALDITLLKKGFFISVKWSHGPYRVEIIRPPNVVVRGIRYIRRKLRNSQEDFEKLSDASGIVARGTKIN